MNQDKIKKAYDRLIKQKKLKEQQDKEFEITDEEVEFKLIDNNNRWSDLI